MSDYYINTSREKAIFKKFLNMDTNSATMVAKNILEEIPPKLMTQKYRGIPYNELPIHILEYLCSAMKATIDTRIKAKAVMLYKIEQGEIADSLLSNEEFLEIRKVEDLNALKVYHHYDPNSKAKDF